MPLAAAMTADSTSPSEPLPTGNTTDTAANPDPMRSGVGGRAGDGPEAHLFLSALPTYTGKLAPQGRLRHDGAGGVLRKVRCEDGLLDVGGSDRQYRFSDRAGVQR